MGKTGILSMHFFIRLGIDNVFTAFVFFDDVNLDTADLGVRAEDDSEGYTNVTINHDKKILILSDSFGFYLNTYLACDIGEIDIIHPMAFDGSIRSYVDVMNPDAVIVLYCERNIKPIDWSNHLSQFDFR